jgi:hypothetical protein
LGQFSKNYRTFKPKLSISSQKYGVGIQNPRSGIRKKPIPDPGVKKAPEPGSATLAGRGHALSFSFSFELLNKKIWANFIRIIELLNQNCQ